MAMKRMQRFQNADSENPPQKLCDFTSHPDSFYFDIIDRFGLPDHYLESKQGCINLLYRETRLETSDSGSPTPGVRKIQSAQNRFLGHPEILQGVLFENAPLGR